MLIAAYHNSIYVVRAGLTAYYTFRLSKAQAHLDDLNAQRDTAVDKFKAATKYDTTQQLLEKYGAAGKESPKSSLDDPSSLTRRKSGRYSGGGAAGQMPARTGLAPPPTANIRRPGDGDRSSVPGTPVRMPTPFVEGFLHQSRLPRSSPQSSPRFPPTTSLEPGAEFAPNAFDSPFNPPAPQSYITGVHAGPSRWYDRILDVLLGEDENRPGNGAVLICQGCRLVNGQLPPGVKSLEDLGAWRCQGCRAWNGRRSETHRALGEKVDASLADAETRAEVAAEVAETAAKIDGHSDEEGSDITGEQDSTPARSTRSRTKSSKTGS